MIYFIQLIKEAACMTKIQKILLVLAVLADIASIAGFILALLK
jgi:hypothetical protein